MHRVKAVSLLEPIPEIAPTPTFSNSAIESHARSRPTHLSYWIFTGFSQAQDFPAGIRKPQWPDDEYPVLGRVFALLYFVECRMVLEAVTFWGCKRTNRNKQKLMPLSVCMKCGRLSGDFRDDGNVHQGVPPQPENFPESRWASPTVGPPLIHPVSSLRSFTSAVYV